mmetsp:Transcript_109490/g.211997  ORF Transcript_109490/g.211997 Transcript_109490/m.211997 type:complete len:229 (+) Transcript_109490:233-919(+)
MATLETESSHQGGGSHHIGLATKVASLPSESTQCMLAIFHTPSALGLCGIAGQDSREERRCTSHISLREIATLVSVVLWELHRIIVWCPATAQAPDPREATWRLPRLKEPHLLGTPVRSEPPLPGINLLHDEIVNDFDSIAQAILRSELLSQETRRRDKIRVCGAPRQGCREVCNRHLGKLPHRHADTMVRDQLCIVELVEREWRNDAGDSAAERSRSSPCPTVMNNG